MGRTSQRRPGHRPRVRSRRATAVACLGIVGLLAGCAESLPRGEAPVRMGDTDAMAAADVGAVGDAAIGPDDGVGAPDAGRLGPPPARNVWLIVRHDAWRDGVRAHLQPPHEPAGLDPRAMLDEAGLLVTWAGPGGPGATMLDDVGDRAVGVLYPLAERVADRAPESAEAIVVADMSSLAAQAPAGPFMVVFDGPWPASSRALVDVARARGADLGLGWRWGATVAPDETPPAVDVRLPVCAVDAPAARQRARQQAVRDGVQWLPCISPPTNARLDQRGAAAEAPERSTLARRLVLARRAGGSVIVVDGVGGWRDDRQLDPVTGQTTGAPISLTTALNYAPYGTGRVDAVRDLLLAPAAPPPGSLTAETVLLELVRSPGVVPERLEQSARGVRLALRDETAAGRYEVLIYDRPFIVPDGAVLRYRRTDPELALDLVFEGGRRLVDVLPDDDGEAVVERRLDPFVGERVEEVTLVYGGGRLHLDAWLERPVIATDP